MSVQVRSGAQGLESKESQPDDTRVAHFIGEAEGRHLVLGGLPSRVCLFGRAMCM
jgi:hypothetical protein